MAKLKRVLVLLTIAVTALAVLDQLRRPAAERTWHGTVCCVPYDFRPPTPARLRAAWWSPEDPRLLTPRDFGVGWAVNLPCLIELVRRKARRGGEA